MNKPQHCHSCAVPIDMPGMEMKSSREHFCKYCVDDGGEVKSREQVRAQTKMWMQMWQGEADDAVLERRVTDYMNAMPHWS